jgi:hypothetical protein
MSAGHPPQACNSSIETHLGKIHMKANMLLNGSPAARPLHRLIEVDVIILSLLLFIVSCSCSSCSTCLECCRQASNLSARNLFKRDMNEKRKDKSLRRDLRGCKYMVHAALCCAAVKDGRGSSWLSLCQKGTLTAMMRCLGCCSKSQRESAVWAEQSNLVVSLGICKVLLYSVDEDRCPSKVIRWPIWVLTMVQ